MTYIHKMLFVAYGFKLYSHTHSYIHHGFIRGFKALGWETRWVDDSDYSDKSGDSDWSDDFPIGTVFLCSGGELTSKIPFRKDCYYIFHNYFPEEIKSIPKEHVLCLQVDTRSTARTGIRLSDASIYDSEDNMLYTLWATDLLPEEIDIDGALARYDSKKKAVIFIGSLNNCPRFGNYQQIMPFVHEAQQKGYEWIEHTSPFSNPVDNEAQRQLISECELAPAIVGHWQQSQGYIPCRIFKSISYGCIGITNSKYVQEVMKGNCICSEDSRELFRLTAEFFEQPVEVIKANLKMQMEFVKEHHTYVNRVQDIMKIFETIKAP